MRQKLFKIISNIVTKRPGIVLIFCAFVTIILAGAAGRLSFKTQIADMLPNDIPQVKELMEIIDDYQSESIVMITIEDKNKDIKKMKKCADNLASRLEKINRIKPSEKNELNLIQKIKIAKGEFPVKGVLYDTLDLVRRVDYKIDDEWVTKHAMMMQKTKDLKNMTDMYNSLDLPSIIKNINDNFEKEFIDDSENLATLDGEEQAVRGLEGIRKFIKSIEVYIKEKDSAKVKNAVTEFLSGNRYFVSSDNSMLLVMLQPSVSFNQFEDMMYLGYRIDDTLDVVRQLKEYDDITIGRTGAMMLQIDENNALSKDFGWPSLFAVVFILVLLIGSFKTWKNPFYSVFTLIIGIIWVTGILAIALHYLNMMSAGFGIVLLGLGIDFGIHFISGFKDGREQGKSVDDSIYYMYTRVGSGVITGALTTSIVFFSLPLTRFEAYSQMGIAMGVGIITLLVAMMLLLPALIKWDNKGYSVIANMLSRLKLGVLISIFSSIGKNTGNIFRSKMISWVSVPLQFKFLDHSGKMIKKLPVSIIIIIISIVLLIISVIGALNIKFEYDMMELQPKGTPGVITQDKILDKFEISPDYAMIKAKDLKTCREMVKEYKKIGDRTGLIGKVDAITDFIPSKKTQEKNIEIINSFRNKIKQKPTKVEITKPLTNMLINELRRLHYNIVEIGELSILGKGQDNKIIRKCDQIVGKKDEDSYILYLLRIIKDLENSNRVLTDYQNIMGPKFKEKILSMTSTSFVNVESLPKDIKEKYVNKKNHELLVTVYPKSYIWEQRSLSKFNELTSRVSERITGMPIIVQLMMNLIVEKGKIAVIIGFIAVFIFLLIDFRSFKYSIFAIIPLIFGTVWMVGLMYVLNIKISMANFIALPLIIGIGIDDGVHILHRYKKEGIGSIPLVLKYTGRAILLTSLTTMIGFGSMGLASHKGIASMGLTLFLGVGACFISAAFVLPSILSIVERFTKTKE